MGGHLQNMWGFVLTIPMYLLCGPTWAIIIGLIFTIALINPPLGPLTPAVKIAQLLYLLPLMGLINLVLYVPQLLLPETIKTAYVHMWATILGIQYGVFDSDSLNWFQIPTPQIGLPKALRGVFWMDGNGIGNGYSDVGCVHGGDWDSLTNTLLFPLYQQWTFSHDPGSLGDIVRANMWRWTYVFHFNDKVDLADITLRLWGCDVPTKAFPFLGDLCTFRMTLQPDGSWNRDTWGMKPPQGKPDHVYYLRYLMDEHGKVDEAQMEAFKAAMTRETSPVSTKQLIRVERLKRD